MKVLLLAGTTEAREFAELAACRSDVDVLASFAGVTATPRPLPCNVRVGGFGGIDALAGFLKGQRFDALVDATHPFASTMPRHALAAACETSIRHVRLVRPPWRPSVDDDWIDVHDGAAAASEVARRHVSPVLLTIGRLDLEPFASVAGIDLVVRTVEANESLPFEPATLVEARGPFTVAEESRLLEEHDIRLLVTKNSGGDDAKLRAARAARLPVVMIGRPPPVDAPTVSSARDALTWLLGEQTH
jgi:precorrin-6A/cobalt-precorrin-6A reductase